ncbi:hypothetical protein EJ04DRAFT_130411 [Polyplosphaeria fusca]|uniref:Uncharacterized protein n=1 Tax=Polyplosphaeria fusca TaxID=682080 RepID=A0A9P4R5L5_9PLEO|nr:hypothetical protein EJ04DRAFT_130411 [Polyplosphaeria fusca]
MNCTLSFDDKGEKGEESSWSACSESRSPYNSYSIWTQLKGFYADLDKKTLSIAVDQRWYCDDEGPEKP